MAFFFDLFVNGLMIGSMYALVALGFVLIYKATSVVNFAQGELVMFGGYIAAALVVLYKLPLPIALPVLLGSMVALGFIVERGVLRPMASRSAAEAARISPHVPCSRPGRSGSPALSRAWRRGRVASAPCGP